MTGRPRRDAERFLERFELGDLFEVVVGMEDADTPDDARAARSAGVLPLGVLPPDSADAVSPKFLEDAGCVRVLSSLSELKELLP